jgi:hypothetical protein
MRGVVARGGRSLAARPDARSGVVVGGRRRLGVPRPPVRHGHQRWRHAHVLAHLRARCVGLPGVRASVAFGTVSEPATAKMAPPAPCRIFGARAVPPGRQRARHEVPGERAVADRDGRIVSEARARERPAAAGVIVARVAAERPAVTRAADEAATGARAAATGELAVAAGATPVAPRTSTARGTATAAEAALAGVAVVGAAAAGAVGAVASVPGGVEVHRPLLAARRPGRWDIRPETSAPSSAYHVAPSSPPVPPQGRPSAGAPPSVTLPPPPPR